MVTLIILAAAQSLAGLPQNPNRIARACAEDAARFCPNEQGRAVPACLAQHHVSLTLVCRQALNAAKAAPANP